MLSFGVSHADPGGIDANSDMVPKAAATVQLTSIPFVSSDGVRNADRLVLPVHRDGCGYPRGIQVVGIDFKV